MVISRAGSIGHSILIKNPKETIFASYLIRFRPMVNRSYFSYFLKSPYYWASILEKSLGIAIPNINASKLRQIPFPLAPFNEQHRIVAKIEELFTRLDAGVEALKKIKAQLKRYRQAVLKYAFEGKLTQEWREANKDKLEPASILLEKIKEERKNVGANLRVRPDSGQIGQTHRSTPTDAFDLPELPEGWVWTRVRKVADSIHYGYTSSASKNKVGPKFLRITDIQNNSVNWDSVPYCKIEDSKIEKYLLKDGDLIFARTGATVGKSFLIKGNIPEAVFASYLIRIIFNKNVNNGYIYKFFQSNTYWNQIQKSKIGIGQPNVNAQTLSQIYLPLSPLPEQHKIVEEIEMRFSVADEIEKVVDQSLKQAERLRQSIMKRAFEGKLVPQDPTDEPAEKLLERIKNERAKQESEKKIRSDRRKRNEQKTRGVVQTG